MRSSVSFDDVLLVPKYSEIFSRKEIDLTTRLDHTMQFSLPIISSPMDTVTETDMAKTMFSHGGLGVIHRYNSIKEQSFLVSQCEDAVVAAAIGVSGDYLDRARSLLNNGADILCVDIAHGHHALMRHALTVLRNTFGPDVHIMAGNVATKDGYEALVEWGASSVRVGIGGGSICSTRIQTGHGVPTLQSIIDCATSEFAGDIPIIADGGIKNSGDIVKALAAGADFVMLGSLLAGTTESPGEVHGFAQEKYKVYRGMASKDAQMEWRGHTSSEEGVSSTVPFKGSVSEVVKSLETGIRSGLSYSGASSISQFQSSSTFIQQTSAGSKESNTHILDRSL